MVNPPVVQGERIYLSSAGKSDLSKVHDPQEDDPVAEAKT
jgi:hypothetical protein